MPKFKVKVVKFTNSTKVIAVTAKNVDEAIVKAYANADQFLNLGFTEEAYRYGLGWVENANLSENKTKKRNTKKK